MSKSLEALNLLMEDVNACVNSGGIHYIDMRNYEIIKKELKRLDEIDNAMFLNNKKLKALEIIKNKGVNVGNFKDMLEDWKDITFENYLNYHIENGYDLQNDYDFVTNPLTEEEYDLLKEVLL